MSGCGDREPPELPEPLDAAAPPEPLEWEQGEKLRGLRVRLSEAEASLPQGADPTPPAEARPLTTA